MWKGGEVGTGFEQEKRERERFERTYPDETSVMEIDAQNEDLDGGN